MIEQGPVQAGDQTAPASIQDIRGRITRAVDATQGSALDQLKIWLQMPSEPGFTDPTCLIRAADVASALSISVARVFQLVATGDIPAPLRRGRLAYWTTGDLQVIRRMRGAA